MAFLNSKGSEALNSGTIPAVQASPGRRLSLLLSGVLVLAGSLMIAGWVYHVPILKGAMFGTFVAPNTALLLLLTGISIAAQGVRRLYIPGLLIGFLVGGLAATILFQYATGIDIGVDRFFLASRLPDWNVPTRPGRMAAPTTFAFVLVGTTLVWLKRRNSLIVDLGAAGVLTTGYLAVLGYVYGLRPFYGYIMALPTACLLVVTAVALLAAANTSQLRDVVLSSEAGGIMLRRMGPLVIVLLPILGWARLTAQKQGWIPLEFGTALFVLTVILVFTGSALLTAATLNRVDAQRKQAQQALIRTEKLAAAGRLAATVAHEINNPLAAALNTIYLARTSDSLKEVNRFLEIAERELTRVSAVTRQSLGFYRGQTKASRVDLHAALTEVVDVFRSAAAAKGIALECRCRPGVSVIAEEGELRQIFSNLIANAIDATGKGGHVTLEAVHGANGLVEITVADDGCGIAAESRNQVFEPFFTTKPNVGTGLGLFVVKELVAKNKGELNLVSSVDAQQHGTRLTIKLPMAAPISQGQSLAI